MVKTLISRTLLMKSIKSLFYAIKTILLLLMDKDVEICGKASSIVSEITDDQQINVTKHAQEMLINYLLTSKIPYNDHEKFTIFSLLIEDEKNNREENIADDEINEFVLFDKNAMSFETFCTTKLLKNALKALSQSIHTCESN